MKVAVTGASGFIGRHIVADFTERGHEVLALGRDIDRLQAVIPSTAVAAATDYDRASLDRLLVGVDGVIHLAGRRTQREDDPLAFEPFQAANIAALETLFLAARDAGARDFVLASSIAVYSAANASPYRESEPVVPLNPYGVSKASGELLLDLWGRKSDLRTTSLRLAAAYGYGERISAVLMKFVDTAMAGKPLTLRGNTQIAIDQVYVRDVVGAFAAALDASGAGGVFNIGSGRAFTLAQMAEAVNAAFDNVGNLLLEDIVEAPAPPAPFMDIAAAAHALNWTPKWSLEEALTDFHATWRRANDR